MVTLYMFLKQKIPKSDWRWLTALISVLVGQFSWTVRGPTRHAHVIGQDAQSRSRLNGFFFSLLAKKNLEFLVF